MDQGLWQPDPDRDGRRGSQVLPASPGDRRVPGGEDPHDVVVLKETARGGILNVVEKSSRMD